MRKTVLVLLGLAMLVVGTANARFLLLAVLETQSEVYVDTLDVDDEAYTFADFGGVLVTDTVEVAEFDDFPRHFIISFTVDGERRNPVELDRPEPDVWYPLEGFDQPANILFTRTEPGIQEQLSPAPVRSLRAEPNPFSVSSRLRWELEAPARVVARVFDRSGRAVRTLADADLGAGSHMLTWDGCDAEGNRLGAGVYLMQLRAAQEDFLLKLLRTE